jgi:predicted Fe-S protein YdhL (DUF1289 family)
MHPIVDRAALVRAAVAKGLEPVPSPCTSVCRMDAATGWCLGCWRTLDEIAHWSAMDDAQRLAVWARLEQRIHDTETHGP